MKVVLQAIKKTEIYKVGNAVWANKPILLRDEDYCEKELIVIKEIEVENTHILLNTYNYDEILISDYKGNKVDGEFRILYDLEEDAVYLNSDVCVELVEPNKEEMGKELEVTLRIWNKETIEKDERLNAYCELHKLDKETVDINQLKRLVPSYATGGMISNESFDELLERMKRISNNVKFA